MVKNIKIKTVEIVLNFRLKFFYYKILNKKYKQVDEAEDECPEGLPYLVVHKS